MLLSGEKAYDISPPTPQNPFTDQSSAKTLLFTTSVNAWASGETRKTFTVSAVPPGNN